MTQCHRDMYSVSMYVFKQIQIHARKSICMYIFIYIRKSVCECECVSVWVGLGVYIRVCM